MRKIVIGFALTALFYALCLPVWAQQAAKVPRIGYLALPAKPSARDEAFAKQLRDLGWVDGQNIVIEYRWAANKPENLAALADELVALKVDIIAAADSGGERGEERNEDNSHRHDERRRCGRKRVCR
jgi:ABC-type uncharacterized transport system substrate-binding protein